MKEIIDRVLAKIKPSDKETERMNSGIKNFVSELERKIKKNKVKAEVFVGGSSGKGTVVKQQNSSLKLGILGPRKTKSFSRRKKQDVDIFVRFIDKDEKISEMLESILKNFKHKKIHGSRDYFKVSFEKLKFEVVPVLKIKKPEEAKNVTDLSFLHVSYVRNALGISDHPKKAKLFSGVNKKMREKDLRDDIRLAKAFCYASGCYGAESYINGFSGYALELLIIYYKSFVNMIKKISKLDIKKKLVVDLEKYYKGKKIEEEMNESKLSSPIVFIDPTFKGRNVLSALSYDTFLKFQEACKKFLKKPEEKFFFKQEIEKNNFNLILQVRTSKQEGDIAGSKLWKFYNLLKVELGKNFIIKKTDFDYNDKKKADLYFKIKARKEIIFIGPPIVSVENVSNFRKKHKNCFIKNNKVYAKEKSQGIREFLNEFKTKNKSRMKEMGIVSLK